MLLWNVSLYQWKCFALKSASFYFNVTMPVFLFLPFSYLSNLLSLICVFIFHIYVVGHCFYLLFVKIFIYMFVSGCPGSPFPSEASLHGGVWASLAAERGSRCAGFSGCSTWAQESRHAGSRAWAQELWRVNLLGLQHARSSRIRDWILHWQADSYPLDHQGGLGILFTVKKNK